MKYEVHYRLNKQDIFVCIEYTEDIPSNDMANVFRHIFIVPPKLIAVREIHKGEVGLFYYDYSFNKTKRNIFNVMMDNISFKENINDFIKDLTPPIFYKLKEETEYIGKKASIIFGSMSLEELQNNIIVKEIIE